MAKYLGTYASKAAAESAVNSGEISRPFVIYTTDTKRVYYGTSKIAAAGDIVVCKDGILYSISQDAYNTDTYPTDTYVPVGIVAIAPEIGLEANGTEKTTLISLNYMSLDNPEAGSASVSEMLALYSGDNESDCKAIFAASGSSFSFNSASDAAADMDGKAHTALYLSFYGEDWKSESTVDGNLMGPERCAWFYHTNGTSQGDWYIPAAGELLAQYGNLSAINSARTMLGLSEMSDGGTMGFVSTSFETNYGPYFHKNGTIDSHKGTYGTQAFAFAQMVIEPLA